jgi:hypothetical protein
MINVKLTCNWCDDESLYKRFTRCYVSKYNINPNICFTNSSNYDWLIVINHPHYNINFPKERTIGIIMEPKWTGHYELKYLLEDTCKYIITHTIEDSPQYIFYPGLTPFHFDYEEGNNLDYYIDNKFNKTKKCSMVVSYNTDTPHSSCLYKKRTEFALQILKTDLDIDMYGNNWDNSHITDSRIKGPIPNKIDALRDYEFSIAIENCIEPDYFTEKITDCILTDTTPIYYGCPKMDRFFNNIYQLNSIDNVNQLTNILSTPKLEQTNNKMLLATKFNLYTAIDKLITKLNTK